MTGWQWFWTLVGLVIYLIVLIFLYFYQPFETLFEIVVYGLSYSNAIFWTALVIGIVGFCIYHWRAYRLHIVQQRSVEAMVLSSLRGSTYVAILLTGGAALQALQILCVYLLDPARGLDADFGKRLVAIVALILLTGLFCIIFWLLRVIKTAGSAARAS